MRRITAWNIAAGVAAALYAMSAYGLSQAQIAYLSELKVGWQATYRGVMMGYQYDDLLWTAAEVAGWQAAALFLGTRTYWVLYIPGLLVVYAVPAFGLVIMLISIVGIALVVSPHVQIFTLVTLFVAAMGLAAIYAGIRHEENFLWAARHPTQASVAAYAH